MPGNPTTPPASHLTGRHLAGLRSADRSHGFPGLVGGELRAAGDGGSAAGRPEPAPTPGEELDGG